MKKTLFVCFVLICGHTSQANYIRCESEKWNQTFYLDLATKDVHRINVNGVRPFLTKDCGCTWFCSPFGGEEMEWDITAKQVASKGTYVEYFLEEISHGFTKYGLFNSREDGTGVLECSDQDPIFLSSCAPASEMNESSLQ